MRGRQLAAVFRLEIGASFLNRRSWWIYLMAFGPVLITAGHSVAMTVRTGGRCSVSGDVMAYATIFQLFFLRLAIYFGCVGIFTSLFRNEVLNKTLHYYFLTPMRREVLVAGKYLSGVVASVTIFSLSVLVSYLAMGIHFGEGWKDYLLAGPGLGHLGWYLVITVLACIGYGAVFLVMGMLFRNPMIPAAVIMVWEGINNFLPSALKKVSVVFYLKSLLPMEVPLKGSFAAIAVAADPVPAWLGIPSVLLVASAILLLCALRARTMEISYTE
jgi:ABC-type transport system involved in multi-copper enzyme maturation permease subunit